MCKRIFLSVLLPAVVFADHGNENPPLPGFEVSYAPEVVFAGDPLTFQLSTETQAAVTLSPAPSGESTRPLRAGESEEITLRLNRTTVLRFTDEAQAGYLFRVTAPNPLSVFTEEDGYLHEQGDPVILLPTHRQPPPLDRRWQTVDELSRRVIDRRKPLGGILWLSEDDRTLKSLSPRLSETDPHHLPPHEEAWFPLHGYLMASAPESADFLVVEIDARDLERGMPPHEWLMKWQFVLQTAEARTGVEKGILLGPVPGPHTRPWMEWFNENLPPLAQAHGLIYVDRSLPEATWRERLFHRLNRDFLLP